VASHGSPASVRVTAAATWDRLRGTGSPRRVERVGERVAASAQMLGGCGSGGTGDGSGAGVGGFGSGDGGEGPGQGPPGGTGCGGTSARGVTRPQRAATALCGWDYDESRRSLTFGSTLA